MTRQLGERRQGRRWWLALLFVLGMGFGALLNQPIPAPVLAQQSPNVAIREPSGTDTKIAVLEERIRAMDTALLLQAMEYKEHFQRLNGEQARIAEILKQSVPREVFENYKAENTAWREKTDRALILIEGRTGGAGALNASIVMYVLLIAAIVGVVLNWLRLRRPGGGSP